MPETALLQQLIAQQATAQPAGVALWWRGVAIDYASLQRNVLAVAGRLATGGAVGDRIALLSWNCPEFVELLYGVPAAGRILVPLNARLAPAELIYQLQSAGATTLFGDPDLLQPLLAQADFPRGIRIIALGDAYRDWRDNPTPRYCPAPEGKIRCGFYIPPAPPGDLKERC